MKNQEIQNPQETNEVQNTSAKAAPAPPYKRLKTRYRRRLMVANFAIGLLIFSCATMSAMCFGMKSTITEERQRTRAAYCISAGADVIQNTVGMQNCIMHEVDTLKDIASATENFWSKEEFAAFATNAGGVHSGNLAIEATVHGWVLEGIDRFFYEGGALAFETYKFRQYALQPARNSSDFVFLRRDSESSSVWTQTV